MRICESAPDKSIATILQLQKEQNLTKSRTNQSSTQLLVLSLQLLLLMPVADADCRLLMLIASC